MSAQTATVDHVETEQQHPNGIAAEGSLPASSPAPDLPPSLLLEMYEGMLLGRRVSERTLQLHRAGQIHLAVPCDGHEAAQVGSALAMPRGQSIVLPYYRSWAAVLAYGMTPLDIFLAVFAKGDDPSSGGKQMPGHFCRRDLDIITTSSVVATQIPHAAGAAYAAKLRKTGQVAIAYFGEGGTSEGDFHEGLNFAAIHTLPVIFFCENNEYAISVPVAKQMAVANVADRAPAYGIAGRIVDGNDVIAVYRATTEAVERARRGDGPTLIEAKTYRTGPHTSDDDDRGYRDPEETKRWRTERDPILRHERGLRAAGLLTDEADAAIKARVDKRVEEAIETARSYPDPDLKELAAHVYGV